MQDQVAEILGERAALDSGAAAGIILSLVLHGALAAAAVYAATHAKSPQVASVLNIRFAPVAQTLMSVPAQKKPQPRIESPKPQPVKPVETKKPVEKNTVPFSPFGKSAKKGSEHPVPPPKPQPPTVSGAPSTSATSTQAGVTASLEGGDFPYTIYLERMKTTIGSNWFHPQSAANAVVVISFVIDRDGSIRDAKVETSSGNGMADRAALRAVLESSPLPPLPFGYNGTYLGVHLTFR